MQPSQSSRPCHGRVCSLIAAAFAAFAAFAALLRTSLFVLAGETFVPVSLECPARLLANTFQINSIAVALAASYYQRLADVEPFRDPADAFFRKTVIEGVATYVRDNEFSVPLRREQDWSLIIFVGCLDIATKLVHCPRNCPRRLGGFCFNNFLRRASGTVLAPHLVYQIEFWIMRALNYDLLPRSRPNVSTTYESDMDVEYTDINSECSVFYT